MKIQGKVLGPRLLDILDIKEIPFVTDICVCVCWCVCVLESLVVVTFLDKSTLQHMQTCLEHLAPKLPHSFATACVKEQYFVNMVTGFVIV